MNNVNHPKHYNHGKIEVIEFLEDQFMDRPHEWNAVKYLARAGKKNPAKETEDLKKAIWYIERKIELLNGEQLGSKVRRPNEMNRNVSEPIITKVADKPTTKVTSPANQSELLARFLDPKAHEFGLVLDQAKKDAYKEGHKDGFNVAQEGTGGKFDPKLHVDKSFYGYASIEEIRNLGTPKSHMTILRDKNDWAKKTEITFIRITPIEGGV